MHIHSLDAFEVPDIPDFDALFVVTGDHHRGALDGDEGDDHGLVPDHLAAQAGVQVDRIDL